MGESHAQWLEERRRGIGGSDVAAILGMNPWKSAFRVYQEKRKEVDDWQGNEATDWGKRMEPAIRQWYSDISGRCVRIPEKIMFHENHPYMLASLDGFTDDGRVVEIKTARSGKGWGEPGTNEIPDYYTLQCQHYLAVTGFDVADVPVSIGGGSPVLYEVPADRELQEMIIEAEADFWQRVVDGNPPDPVTYADAVAKYGRVSTEGIVAATTRESGIYVSLKHLQEEIKALEAKEEEYKAALIKALGDKGDALTYADKTIATYKLSKGRTSFDSKALQKDLPEIYQKYVTTGEAHRRFLLK